MRRRFDVGLADRLKAAADAKRSLLGKLQVKPTQTDPLHAERAAMRQAHFAEVRVERAHAKAAKKQAADDAAAEVLRAQAAAEDAALALKRGARKALTAVEAKAKRDAKYAARQARR